jgi:hypothetical protein
VDDVLVQAIENRLPQAAHLYYHLIVVAGAAGTGKTAALRTLSRRLGTEPVNVNLELSRRLLEVAERRRPLAVMPALQEIVRAREGEVVFLDNLEMLFHPALRQDPLRCLQLLARQRTVVATWSGTFANGDLAYGEPGHAEYCRRRAIDFLVVDSAKVSGKDSSGQVEEVPSPLT